MLIALCLATPLALAAPQDPLPSAIVGLGLPLPGSPGGNLVFSSNTPRSTPDGGFGLSVRLGGVNQPLLFGTFGGAPSVLVNGQQQGYLIRPELQLAGGQTAYVGSLPGPCNGYAVWQGTTSLLCDGDPSPVPGQSYGLTIWTRLLGAAPNGEFFVHANLELLFGTTADRVLLRGPAMTPVLVGGDSIPGLNFPVQTVSIARSSPRASHYAAIARLDNPNQDDPVLVVDGAAPLVDGLAVRVGNLVAPNSTSTERWFRLYDCAVSEAGSWMVRGRTNGAGPVRDVVMRDGEIALREGDTLDGLTLGASIPFLGFGADGREILVWTSSSPTQPLHAALFVDRKAVLRHGGPVDVDGDGVADPAWSIAGIAALAIPYPTEEQVDIDEDGVLRATTIVTDGNTTRSLVFELPLGTGQTTCEALPNSTGFGATLVGAGTARVAANAFELRAAQLPPGEFGYFLVATDAALPGPTQPNLCVGGSVGRVLASLAQASPTGTLEHTLDLGGLPQPTGTVAVQPGDTWHFQCWFRDGTGLSGFSSGLQVLFR